ncbi:MAG TPA: hypothetical protein VMT34_16350, partial [Aggregatilineales bacterium]|nr:hypothetical protein [Aggregatilineales bacterium]
QKVEFHSGTGKAPQITRLLGPTDGTTGSWDIQVGKGISQVMITISGLAEYTTQQPPFQYTLTRKP